MEKQKETFRHPTKTKLSAKELYIKGLTVSDISLRLNVPERTVINWRTVGKWDEYCPPDNVETTIARRICRLTEMDKKSPTEVNELAKLVEMFGKMNLDLAKAEKIKSEAAYIKKNGPPSVTIARGNESELGDSAPTKERKNKYKKAVKNDISAITTDMLDAVRTRLFYAYQLLWFAVKNDSRLSRIRFILKSRQIGATYYFAFEALDDAIRTGDNQIFLSSSRDQADVFKAYIIAFAKNEFDVELKGTGVILLSNGAEIRFLSTNSTTAQSYHGHLYIDEVFWIPNFDRINKVASGIAAHKKWRKTYFSTPSAQGHQAYKLWTGEKYNNNLPVKKRKPFDLSHAILKQGEMFHDGIWRHIVTVEDAQEQGCDLFDIKQLKLEYSTDEFNNLFMCLFIDDSQSVFNLDMLLNCIVEKEEWPDYTPSIQRPFANRPVALGYDPSRTTDNATLAVLDIPTIPSQPFRLLDMKSCRGRNFDYQANRIKEVVDSHNVQHIGIDITGMGVGVFEQVEKFYPMATPIHYSLEMKNRLVVKALDLIGNKRFSFLASNKEVVRSFLMIKQTVSNSSGAITYNTDRTAESGHADEAWAIMHAFAYEPLAGSREGAKVTFGN